MRLTILGIFLLVGMTTLSGQTIIDTLVKADLTSPREVLLTDVNTDGFTDIIAFGYQTGVYFLNDDNQYKLNWLLSDQLKSAVSVDLDGDMDSDIIACDVDTGGWLKVFENTGTGWDSHSIISVSSSIDTFTVDDSLRFFLFEGNAVYRLTFGNDLTSWQIDTFFSDVSIHKMEIFNANGDVYPDALLHKTGPGYEHFIYFLQGNAAGFEIIDSLDFGFDAPNNLQRIYISSAGIEYVASVVDGTIVLFSLTSGAEGPELQLIDLEYCFCNRFAIADMDGDLIQDIVYKKLLTDSVYSLLQSPASIFNKTLLLDMTPYGAGEGFIPHDADLDGDLDILYYSAAAIRWLIADDSVYEINNSIAAFGLPSFKGLSKATAPFSDRVFLSAGVFYQIYFSEDSLLAVETENFNKNECCFTFYLEDIDVNSDGITDPFYKYVPAPELELPDDFFYYESISPLEFDREHLISTDGLSHLGWGDFNQDSYIDVVLDWSYQDADWEGSSAIIIYENKAGEFEQYQLLYHSDWATVETSYEWADFITMEDNTHCVLGSRYGIYLSKQQTSGFFESPELIWETTDLESNSGLKGIGYFSNNTQEQILSLNSDTLYLLERTGETWYRYPVNVFNPAYFGKSKKIQIIDLNFDGLDDLVVEVVGADWIYLINDAVFGLTGTWKVFELTGDVVFTDFDNNNQTDLIFFQLNTVLGVMNYSFDFSYEEGFTTVELPVELGNTFLIFPNPAQTKINLKVPSTHNDKLHYLIYNVEGELQQRGIIYENVGYEVGIENLPSGVYKIVLQSDDLIQTCSFIKQ